MVDGEAAMYLREADRVLGPDEEPVPGAHLITPRRGFLHHGIYVGARRVIHYAGLSQGLRRGPVEEVSLARFARGRSVLVRHDAASDFDLLEIVRRARSRLGENGYRLLTNNCEHFCEWCLRGTPRSLQVEELIAPMRAVLTVLRRTAVAPRP
jgi:Lecithin retinol acyltransferase